MQCMNVANGQTPHTTAYAALCIVSRRKSQSHDKGYHFSKLTIRVTSESLRCANERNHASLIYATKSISLAITPRMYRCRRPERYRWHLLRRCQPGWIQTLVDYHRPTRPPQPDTYNVVTYTVSLWRTATGTVQYRQTRLTVRLENPCAPSFCTRAPKCQKLRFCSQIDGFLWTNCYA